MPIGNILVADDDAVSLQFFIAALRGLGCTVTAAASGGEALAACAQMRGAVVVDDGAAVKVRAEGKSLLPIGMVSVEGDFSRGDVIAVRDAAGGELARGLANYSSSEARLLCRKPSADIEKLLGYAAEPEMLHRDNLVLTR